MPDQTNSFKVEAPEPCDACGSREHGPTWGPINNYIACLKRKIARLEGQLAAPETGLSKLRAEVEETERRFGGRFFQQGLSLQSQKAPKVKRSA